MKNWKIKKMSYLELEAQLKGVCQLCKVSRTYHPKTKRHGACKNCLWIIIEGESCSTFAEVNFSMRKMNYVRALTGLKKWHKLRIPMLRRWAKIIQAEMDSRTNSAEV